MQNTHTHYSLMTAITKHFHFYWRSQTAVRKCTALRLSNFEMGCTPFLSLESPFATVIISNVSSTNEQLKKKNVGSKGMRVWWWRCCILDQTYVTTCLLGPGYHSNPWCLLWSWWLKRQGHITTTHTLFGNMSEWRSLGNSTFKIILFFSKKKRTRFDIYSSMFVIHRDGKWWHMSTANEILHSVKKKLLVFILSGVQSQIPRNIVYLINQQFTTETIEILHTLCQWLTIKKKCLKTNWPPKQR